MARMRTAMFEIRAQRERLRLDVVESSPDDPRRPALVATRHLQVEYGMTPREVEVAILLAEGCSNSIVARRLGISPHTARHHTQRVLGKLGVHSRSEAGALLRR
jgi:DNA-binding CsgD family transcriptional regulator